MADVLGRGPVGDDSDIKHELPHLCDQLLKRLPRLTYADPVGSVQVASDFEGIANRILDMVNAILSRYLEQANKLNPPPDDDMPDDVEDEFEII